MRTVGSAYQFRHSRLQDRLADADSDSGNDSNRTSRLPPVNNLRATNHEAEELELISGQCIPSSTESARQPLPISGRKYGAAA
jgi:hypothetical protein